jgi:AAA family ATP:ADP antiporter
MIMGVTLFFVINIELFSMAVGAKLPNIGVIFFIWVGFFSLTVIAQFWSYANDIYSKETGKRLFPIIGIGMTAGPLVGSLIAGHLFSIGIPPHQMLHISSILLLVSLACYALANRREKPKAEYELTGKPLKKGGNGFSLVFKSRYISLIALMFILLNIVNTTGEFILGKLVTSRATMLLAQEAITSEGAYIGEFYGNYFLGVSIIAVILQSFAVSRIVKYGGLRWTLLILPFVALGAYGIIAAGAGFAMVRWSKTLENTTDYSIMNTARQLLWIPTSLEEKYKAKQAVDTFFVRMGDVLSAAYVFAGTTWLSLDVTGFAAGNILLVGIWIGIAFLILREYKRLKVDGTKIEQY